MDKKGSIIVCPNGHEIAELLDDIQLGDVGDWAAKIGNWRQTPAAVGQMPPINCEICGEAWYTWPLLFKTGSTS